MKDYHFGLLGYPLEHSFSPLLHQVALESLGLRGSYDLFPISPMPEGRQEMKDLLKLMRLGSLHGLNVTIPHKISIIPYLDGLSPAAQRIGAVNAILRKGNKLVGANYDCPAFMSDLNFHLYRAGDESMSDHSSRRALLLGAGGSARAVAYGLLKGGWQVLVAARRLEQAQALACAFKQFPQQRACLLEDLANQNLEDFRLIVNATPLGMYPDISTSAWPERLVFPSQALVYDLVYNPPETNLMAAARNSGLPAANGLGMLARQAALSFRAWTGLAPDWKAMYRTLASDLVSL